MKIKVIKDKSRYNIILKTLFKTTLLDWTMTLDYAMITAAKHKELLKCKVIIA